MHSAIHPGSRGMHRVRLSGHSKHSTFDPRRSWWCLHLRVRLVYPSELLNEQRRLGWSISQIAPISHHASAYSGEPLATRCRRHLTSCYGRAHPALHHVAIHITRPNPGMAPGPEGFFTSLHHLTQMLTGHRRPWGRVSRCTWPTIARSRQSQCLSPYYITGHPASAMPADLRTIACYPRHAMALYGGIHSLVAAASSFAHSLAAVNNKPVHVPSDAACSCLATGV